ncbi:MAG TPA: hypothetical protein VK905_01455 [Bacillota bacterium]|nr:hypothetical protein [Bacillota bacterium]
MPFVLGLLSLVAILFVVRLALPGDLRINKKYIGQFIKDAAGNGPKKISTKRLAILIPPGVPEERVYYNLHAEFADGSTREALVHVFYPLEVFHAEKEKNTRASQQEDVNMSDMSTPTMSSDVERLREDPFKDLSEEEQTKAAKELELAAEIRQLGFLTQERSVYPEIISFDTKFSIVVAEPVGTERLDRVLLSMQPEQREELLQGLMQDLAALHSQGETLAGLLMPGVAHNDAMILQQVMSSCELWATLGVGFTPSETQKMLDALLPLYQDAVTLLGPKMGEASPRSFFVREGVARSVEWGRARRDLSGLDLAELLCDPIVQLDPDAEKRLLTLYVKARGFGPDEVQNELLKMSRLLIYFRFVLIGYLITFRQALISMPADRRRAFESQMWPADALLNAITSLRSYLADDVGLADLRVLVDEKLERLAQA